MPQRLISCLGLAIYGMFLAIIIPPAREKKSVRMVVITAMLLSAVFTWAPMLKAISSGFRIIIVTIAVATAAALLAPGAEQVQQEVQTDA